MKTISWLEDDKFFVQNIMRPVAERGFEIKIYEQSADLIADIENVAASCLVVVDLIVPPGSHDFQERYGGLSVLRALAALPAPPPILVFSVVVRKNILDEVKRYTRNVIQKPVRLRDFESAVLGLIESESVCHVD